MGRGIVWGVGRGKWGVVISEDARTRGLLWFAVGWGGVGGAWVRGWVWDRDVCLGCEVRGWVGRYDDI